MLAYVFWHWPRPSLAHTSYVDDLIAYHEALATQAPAGFVRSVIFRSDPAPWIATAEGAYQDWYLLQDYGFLRN